MDTAMLIHVRQLREDRVEVSIVRARSLAELTAGISS
jgi:hypothetical protein